MSSLTLQSHNISANQIRQDANARRAAALASHQAAGDDNDAPSPSAEPEPAPPRRKETKAQEAKRKKEEEVRPSTNDIAEIYSPHLESNC